MKDNLFDTKFTFLDAVKILLLIVTAFSTWNVVDLMTPDGSLSFVREVAALGVVEGAFLGFEFATANAKNKRQVNFATWGFFCSLAVIGLFAAGSGLLEFGGEALLSQSAGEWLGLQWMARDVVMVSALIVLVVWIVVLASIYRFYSLADPEKEAELALNLLDEEVTRESNNATKIALEKARPDIASSRAVAHVKSKYKDVLGMEEMADLTRRVATRLKENYSPADKTVVVDPELGFVPADLSRSFEQVVSVVNPEPVKGDSVFTDGGSE